MVQVRIWLQVLLDNCIEGNFRAFSKQVSSGHVTIYLFTFCKTLRIIKKIINTASGRIRFEVSALSHSFVFIDRFILQFPKLFF